MTILYKLTDANGYTRRGQPNALFWAPGVSHEVRGDGAKLCTSDVIHAYEFETLAFFLDPAHGGYGASAKLWRCEGEIIARDGQLKCGVKRLTVLEEIEAPKPTTLQRVAFAIYCGQSVHQSAAWNRWADDWLTGKDRSAAAAAAAWAAAQEAARAAAWTAARAETWAETWAARAETWAARAETWAAAAWTAEAAARAETWAADLPTLAAKALAFEG